MNIFINYLSTYFLSKQQHHTLSSDGSATYQKILLQSHISLKGHDHKHPKRPVVITMPIFSIVNGQHVYEDSDESPFYDSDDDMITFSSRSRKSRSRNAKTKAVRLSYRVNKPSDDCYLSDCEDSDIDEPTTLYYLSWHYERHRNYLPARHATNRQQALEQMREYIFHSQEPDSRFVPTFRVDIQRRIPKKKPPPVPPLPTRPVQHAKPPPVPPPLPDLPPPRPPPVPPLPACARSDTSTTVPEPDATFCIDRKPVWKPRNPPDAESCNSNSAGHYSDDDNESVISIS